MVNHCRAEAIRGPREACGVLAGPADLIDEVTELHKLANVHDRPEHRWRFDPDEQIALWHDLDSRRMRPRISYHSHLDTDAVMSDEDLRYARDPSLGYLVVSLSQQLSRLWVVVGGQVIEGLFEVGSRYGMSHPIESLDR